MHITFRQTTLFATLFAFFILLRLGTILTAVERVSYPDSLATGTLALESVQGMKLPASYYQPDYYSGEPVSLNFLTTFCFKLLGPSLFALLLSRLLYALILVGTALVIAVRWFSIRGAFITLALFVFAPPTLAEIFLMPMMAHAESIFFTLLILISYTGIQKKEGGVLPLAGFGFLSGFGFWIFPQTLIMTASCLVCFLYRRAAEDRRYLAGQIGIFLLFAGLGLAPWWNANFAHGWKELAFLGDSSIFAYGIKAALREMLLKTTHLMTRGFFICYSTYPVLGIPGALYSTLYSFSILIPLLIYFREKVKSGFRAKEGITAPLFLYPCMHLSFFAFSRFDAAHTFYFFDMRYLSSWIFFSVFSAALVISSFRTWKRFLLFPLLLGILGQAPMLFQEAPGRALDYKGYSYVILGGHMKSNWLDFPRYKFDFPDYARLLRSGNARYFLMGALELDFSITEMREAGNDHWEIPMEQPFDIQMLYAERLGVAAGAMRRSRAEIEVLLNRYPQTLHPYLLAGYFTTLEAEDLRTWLVPGQQAPSSLAKELACRRAGMLFSPENPSTPDFSLECREEVSWFYRGTGDALFCDDCLYRPDFQRSLETFPELRIPAGLKKKAGDIAWAFGWNIRKTLPEDRPRAMDWINRIPAAYRDEALTGFAACEKAYEIPH